MRYLLATLVMLLFLAGVMVVLESADSEYLNTLAFSFLFGFSVTPAIDKLLARLEK